MIGRPWHTSWVDPNFYCNGFSPDGRKHEWVAAGRDATEILKHLRDRGWTDLSVNSFDFQGHLALAMQMLAENNSEVTSGRSPNFRPVWWSVLKAHLFSIFENKCAYCDSYVLDVSPGDVEHFRPKAKLDGDPSHPGYYWLAYEPSNLLPSCENCNRFGGKKSSFPVVEGTRAYRPADLENELALLINPYLDDPADHLEFLDNGVVKAKTERGFKSIEIYHLNRLPLVEARKRASRQLSDEFLLK